MTENSKFAGFPKECLTFYRELANNNNTIWFKLHKSDFEENVLKPARSFIADMGERLLTIAPGINADPRINHSLFRINRDTRFSKDKTPYKTHLAIWFWEGSGKRMESSGYYVHTEAGKLMLGVGIYCFPRPLLEKYREYVVHKKHGHELARAIEQVASRGPYTLGGSHYKRIPHGFNSEHKNASLLLHNGLYMGMETEIPEAFYSSEFVDYCFKRFTDMSPLHNWLAKLIG
ncbi:MAG: DUF2461 domain-containing protein [Candidatus Latescibacteria bacterium]|nr:DUF2461 domain-containing protein [Candidatus Latescibacterota bacterium]